MNRHGDWLNKSAFFIAQLLREFVDEFGGKNRIFRQTTTTTKQTMKSQARTQIIFTDSTFFTLIA
jgi:hypothetical protein